MKLKTFYYSFYFCLHSYPLLFIACIMYEQLFAAQFMRPVATFYKCAKTDVRTPVAILKLVASMFFVYSTKVGKSSPEHPCSSGRFTRNAPAGYQQGKRRFCCFYPGYGFHRFRCHIPSRADEAHYFAAQPRRKDAF